MLKRIASQLMTRDGFELWFYRVGGFVLLNFVDDPAWLALMFC